MSGYRLKFIKEFKLISWPVIIFAVLMQPSLEVSSLVIISENRSWKKNPPPLEKFYKRHHLWACLKTFIILTVQSRTVLGNSRLIYTGEEVFFLFGNLGENRITKSLLDSVFFPRFLSSFEVLLFLTNLFQKKEIFKPSATQQPFIFEKEIIKNKWKFELAQL